MNDIILNKKESIELCIHQIRTYYALAINLSFEEDYLRQDAIAINLQRACEQCIDLANYMIKVKKLGLPRESRDSFRLLAKNHIIPADLADKLSRMIGFRNILVHEYQQVNVQLMVRVIERHLDDFVEFTDYILKEAS